MNFVELFSTYLLGAQMVKERLMQPDAEENGWLLDGYPRSLSQTMALEDLGIRPDLFILLEVRILFQRVINLWTLFRFLLLNCSCRFPMKFLLREWSDGDLILLLEEYII